MAVVDDGAAPGRPEMGARILAERLQVFHEQTKDALVGHTVIGAAVGILLFDFGVDLTKLTSWILVMLSVAAARLLVYRGFTKEAGSAGRSRIWAWRFEIIALISGATFGALPVLFVQSEHFKISACILLVLAGMAGGALGTLSAHARAFRFYAAALILPTVSALAYEAQLDLAIIAAMFLLTLVYFDRFSRRFEASLVHQIRERLVNADLLENIRRQGEVLDSVLQSIPNAIAVVGPDDRFLYRNDQFVDLFEVPEGLLSRELSSNQFNQFRQDRGDFDHLEPGEFDAQIKAWDRLKTTAGAFGYMRTTKAERILRVENHPMPGGGWVRSWIDSTETVRAEQETARKSALLQLTLDNIDQGLSVVNADGVQVMANRRYCELLDFPLDILDRPTPLSEIVQALEDRGELFDMSPELTARMDAWESGESASDRVGYERLQKNGTWLLVLCRRLPDGGHVRTFTDITERKLAEREAQARRDLLESMLANIEQGVIVRDADDNIQLYNDRLAEMLEVPVEMYARNASSEEMKAFHDSQPSLVADPPPPEVAEWFARKRAGLPVGRLEYQREATGGRYLHVVFQPLEDGREIRTFSDVTNLKVIGTELREKTDFLEGVLASLEQGVMVTDADGRIELWNDRAFRILGPAPMPDPDPSVPFPAPSPLDPTGGGQSPEEILAYFDVWGNWLDMQADGDSGRHEHHLPNGRWILTFDRDLPDGGTVRTLTDITARRVQEARALEAKEIAEATRARMQAILQTLPVGVLTYDNAQRIEFWNDSYCEINGFAQEVLDAKPDFVTYSKYIFAAHNRSKDMDLNRFMEYRHRVYSSEELYSREFVFDRTGLDVQYMVSPLPDGGRINVIVDITPQKTAERAAIEARDASEQATHAKSAFLAAMSHEIRTPMNGVMGMAEILQQTNLDADQSSIVGTIIDSGRSLLRIIDDILDFSKIEAGRMETEAEPVDPRAIAEAVLDTVAPDADAKDLDLALSIASTVPGAFLSDPVRLRQILLNLVGNAVKFTPRGAVSIRLSGAAEPSDPSHTRMRFEIVDTGIGIEQERLIDLFEPFLQAESTTTRRFGGTGLGLTISRRLVAIMGGRIGVRSEPGQGSTFWFELPVEPAAIELPSAPDWAPVAGTRVGLVVRPGPTAEMISDLLETNGLEVTAFEDDGEFAGLLDMNVVIVDGRLGAAKLRRIAPSIDFTDSQSNLRRLWVFGHPGLSPEIHTITRPPRRAALLQAVGIVLGRISPDLVSVADPVASVVHLAELPTADEALAQGRLILVVEDNPVNQLVVRRQLALLGYAAEAAEDGVEAFAMWHRKDYGLVLTDCHMPNMDGYQLATAIRDAEAASGKHRRVPIVALTANAMAGEDERCFAAGMDDYLAKPVPLTVMGQTLGRWLQVDPEGERAGPPEDAATASSEGSRTGLIDRNLLAQILGSDDPEFATAMLSLFVDSYTDLVDRIETALSTGDDKALREAAHAAKGAAANACAGSLKTALQDLELAAARGEAETLEPLWLSAREIGTQVVAEIKRELAV